MRTLSTILIPRTVWAMLNEAVWARVLNEPQDIMESALENVVWTAVRPITEEV